MRKRTLLGSIVGCALACTGVGTAQERGTWRAASTTAKGVTGDLLVGDERITLNFTTFPMAQIHALKPAEMAAVFPESAEPGSGNLYRVSIPAEKRFLHKNTLCGSDETQWVVTKVSGRDLSLALFSGPDMPVLTPEAMANTTNLCGTYAYVR